MKTIWRLLGTFSGATLVGLWWLLVLEQPALQPPSAAAGNVIQSEETIGPQSADLDLEGPTRPPAVASRHAPADPANAPPGPEPEPAMPAEPIPIGDASEPALPPAGLQRDDATPPAATTASALAEPHWHPLWTPFRSQASAQGFAEHLGRLSGRRLTVERIGPGQYRVRLAYQDAADLQLGLARIAEVSGLSPEAPP